MMRQPPDFGPIESYLNNLIGVSQPPVWWNRIARHVVLNECPAAVIRCGYVDTHAPVSNPKARLTRVRKPDLDYSGFTIRQRLRVTAGHPQQNFLAVKISGDVHVPACMRELPAEVHVLVEQLN